MKAPSIIFRIGIAMLVSGVSDGLAQQPIWGKVISSEKADLCTEVKVTPQGEVFLFGFFSDSLEMGDEILAPEPGISSFIIKYDTGGLLKWAYILRGSEVFIENAAVDSQGDIIIEGRFSDKLIFDNQVYLDESVTLGETAFVGKINGTGEPLWLHIFPESSYGNIDIDEIGNIYFTHGVYAELSAPTATWIHKYGANGNLMWKTMISSSAYPSTSYIDAITIDRGQAMVAGMFNGIVTFSGQPFTAPGEFDGAGFFVTKLNADGSTKWVKKMGSSSYNNRSVGDIVTGNAGQFYLSGGLPNQMLLAKYDSLGNMIWGKRTPEGDSFSFSVLGRSADGIYLAANFFKSPKLDEYQLRGTEDSPVIKNSPNVAIMKLTETGKILWLIQFEPGELNSVTSLTKLEDAIYVSGWSTSLTLKLGSLVLPVKNDDPFNSGDGFLVKVSSDPTLPTVELGVDTTLCQDQSLHLSPQGFVSYKWQDNSTDPSFVVRGPGLYAVTVIDQYGNESHDTIRVSGCPGDLFIPNVISCNNDSYNEFFQILGIDLNLFNSLTIFNRWGKVIYRKDSYQNNWNAPLIDPGVYYFQFYYEGTKKFYKGSLHVIK